MGTLPIAIARLMIDCYKPEKRSRNEFARKKRLVDIGMIILQRSVISLSVLRDTYGHGSRYDVKQSLGWLPAAVMKIFNAGASWLVVTEKFHPQALNLLHRQVNHINRKTDALSKEDFKMLCQLVPEAVIPVVNVIISEAAGGLSQRQAKARGISNIYKDYSSVADRFQSIKNKEEEIRMIISKMLHEAPPDELMDEISCDIREFYKPVETKAAQSALAFLKRERELRFEDIAEQAGQDLDGQMNVFEFERYLARLTSALKMMQLTDEDKEILNQLLNVLHTLPSYADVEDSDLESDEEPTVDLLGKVSPQEIAEKYAQYIIDTSNRHKAKLWHALRIMKYTRPNRYPKVLLQWPHVGKLIEEFVKAGGYGTDAWRRTHMLCVGADKQGRVMKTYKVTTETIKDFLATKGIHVSKSTVHYICAQHQFERYASHRGYRMANVVFKRPYRGFDMKYSPDYRWSTAYYKMKEFAEGRKKGCRRMGRDDATNFKCDSLEGQSKNKIPHVEGDQPKKGHTDFKDGDAPTEMYLTGYYFYPSLLNQLVCVYVVKPKALYSKNATQHYDDYTMLIADVADVAAIYDNVNADGGFEIMCHLRDAAPDEAPANLEPEFWATVEHIKRGQIFTCVSTRYPGGSFLNPVERLHSVVKRALNGIFVPSTTWGRNLHWKQGDGRAFFENNMNTASELLMEKVVASYNGTKIQLVKGATTGYSEILDLVQVFLRGSKEERNSYMVDYTEQWIFFEDVKACMDRHSVNVGIDRYQFSLTLCYHPDCIHPICRDPTKHAAAKSERWGPGLPLVSELFCPVADPMRPWGALDCDHCGQGKPCRGHFLPPEEAFAAIREDASRQFKRFPYAIIEEYVQQCKANQQQVAKRRMFRLAKKCLLSFEEIELVVDHLLTYVIYSSGKQFCPRCSRCLVVHMLWSLVVFFWSTRRLQLNDDDHNYLCLP